MINQSNNIITKGWLNQTAIYKGFIIPSFKYEIRKKVGGGAYAISSGYNEENLIRELRDVNQDDIDYIKVYIDWKSQNINYNKKIYAQLITKKIEASIFKENNISNTKINVELI